MHALFLKDGDVDNAAVAPENVFKVTVAASLRQVADVDAAGHRPDFTRRRRRCVLLRWRVISTPRLLTRTLIVARTLLLVAGTIVVSGSIVVARALLISWALVITRPLVARIWGQG
jgi:hypothetical protein